MAVKYSVTEEGKLVALTGNDVLEFNGSKFTPFIGSGDSLFNSKLITESEAMRISSGVKPET